MSINFPYQFKPINEGTIPSAVINLQVKTKIGVAYFDFLVDSGADVSIFPLNWAKPLGFKYNPNQTVWINSAEGNRFPAYPGEINIKFAKKYLLIRCHFVNKKMMPILGRLDVWDIFSITFDNQQKMIRFDII